MCYINLLTYNNVRVSVTYHRCFVHFISVEFRENIESVDFLYLNSTQLSDDRLDRFRGLLPHYLIYFKCIGFLKMGKKLQSEVLFMCLYSLKIWYDRWSAACYQQCSRCRCHTSDMAPVTEFSAVLWLCKYGKNLFFQFFECTLGGHGQLIPAFIFSLFVKNPKNTGWNFVFGSQLLHHLTVMWIIKQIDFSHITAFSGLNISEHMTHRPAKFSV